MRRPAFACYPAGMTATSPIAATVPPEPGGPAKPPAPPAPPRRVVVGWLLDKPLDRHDFLGIDKARRVAVTRLREELPGFEWEMPLAQRELNTHQAAEASRLLDLGLQVRDAERWDFVIVVIARELKAYYGKVSYGAISRTHDAAVLSTARLDPAADSDPLEEDNEREQVQAIARRLTNLSLIAFGHLCDLPVSTAPVPDLSDPGVASVLGGSGDGAGGVTPGTTVAARVPLMKAVRRPSDLDAPRLVGEFEAERFETFLARVADARVEEQYALDPKRGHLLKARGVLPGVRFGLRSLWANRHELASTVFHARPWEFPVRLSRLTAAMVSALLIFILTGETWDLSLSQTWPKVGWFFAMSLVFTTAYVVARQRLFVVPQTQRVRLRRQEQQVVSNAMAVAIVFIGLLSTALFAFAILLFFGIVLFPGELLSGWAGNRPDPESGIRLVDYLKFSAFMGSMGLIVGALGTSFEEQYHFRHVVFVDDEL